MKSGKQRRLEIKARRRERAKKLAEVNTSLSLDYMPAVGAVAADHTQLEHVNTYGVLPNFYVDQAFKCRRCGANEVWTAKQQKWWYEIAEGHIDSIAVHCRPCRRVLKQEKQEQRDRMQEMAEREPHPNEAFFKKRV